MAFYVVAVNRVNMMGSRPRDVGKFEERKDAVAAAQRVIDEWMSKQLKPGMDHRDLFSRFLEFGDVPSVFGDQGHTLGTAFDYTQYALERAKQLCEAPAAGVAQ